MTVPAMLQGPYQKATSGIAQQALILLHGYGADGQDLFGLAPPLQRAFPNAAIYAPNAPHPCEMGPFGRQWFSLNDYDPEQLRRNPQTLAPALEGLGEGARETAPVLMHFIETVCSHEGLTPSQIALVGFSQGTMMALQVGLRTTPPVAGIVGFSGALVGESRLAADCIESPPPVLLIHGDQDSVLPFPAQRLADDALTAAKVPHDTVRCPGLDHGIDEQGVTRAIAFLKLVFNLP